MPIEENNQPVTTEEKPASAPLPEAFIPTPEETVEETADRTFKEMTESGELGTDEETTESEEIPSTEGDQTPEENTTEEQSVQAAAEQKARDEKGKFVKKKKGQQDDGEVIDPPRDWSAEAREFFLTLPKPLQKEHAKIAKEFGDWRVKQVNEINVTKRQTLAQREEVGSLVTMTRRWLPVWGLQNKTPESALNEILNFNNLAVQDPDTALKTLAANTGRQITIHNPKSDPQNPVLTNLESRVKNIESGFSNNHQQQVDGHVSALLTDINSALELVKEEKTEDGMRFVHPDLQDPTFRKQKLEPLFEAYCRSNPNATFDEAIRKMYPVAGGRIIPKSPMKNKLGTSQSGVEAARRASQSAFASGSNGKVSYEADPNESPEDTARKTFEAMYGRQ